MIHFKELVEKANIDYNIRKRYDYYNKLLFNNELPSDFDLKFKNTKKNGGAVKFDYYRRTLEYEIKELYLSSFMLKTEEQLDQILVHEMIHVWMLTQKFIEGVNVRLHGNEFVTKRNELQSKVPFDIPLVDDLSFEVRNQKPIKEVGVIISSNVLGASIMVVNGSLFNSNVNDLKETLLKYGTNGSTYTLGTSTNPNLTQFPLKRTLRKFEFYKLDTNYHEVLKDEIEVKEVIKK